MSGPQLHTLALTLVPDPAWLPLIEDVVRRFAGRMRFSDRLTDMLVWATLEACDNLALHAAASGIGEACRLGLVANDDAVTVDIAYNGRIPLNPLAAGDYEVPDADRDPGSIKADALWLHLIKRRMDKVFFRVDGSRHVLSLVKYRRLEGREGELWVMRLVPRLCPEARFDPRQEDGGGLLYHPAKGVVLRLGPAEAFFVRRFDGQASMYDLYMDYIDTVGLISPNVLVNLYESLEKNGLLMARTRKGARGWGALSHLLNPFFTIPHADAAVGAVHDRLRFLVSPFGAVLLMLVGLSGIAAWFLRPVSPHTLAGLEAFYRSRPLALGGLYLLLLAMVGIHELAHGVVCKHFGGRVHRLGVMFYLAMFVFYCDTTAAYTFPRTSQKLLVSLAGPLATFACLGLGLWAWAGLSGTGSPWEDIWISFCVLTGFGLVMNFNPLVKMDGYFMLMDILGVANLRERSFDFLRERLFGWLLPRADRREVREPDSRERRIFWSYGILGGIFSLASIVWPIVHYARMLWLHSASHGRLVWGAAVLTLVAMRLAHQAQARFWAWRHREYRIQ